MPTNPYKRASTGTTVGPTKPQTTAPSWWDQTAAQYSQGKTQQPTYGPLKMVQPTQGPQQPAYNPREIFGPTGGDVNVPSFLPQPQNLIVSPQFQQQQPAGPNLQWIQQYGMGRPQPITTKPTVPTWLQPAQQATGGPDLNWIQQYGMGTPRPTATALTPVTSGGPTTPKKHARIYENSLLPSGWIMAPDGNLIFNQAPTAPIPDYTIQNNTQPRPSYRGGGGGGRGFGTRYANYGGTTYGDNGGGYSGTPSWLMGLYSWNFKG